MIRIPKYTKLLVATLTVITAVYTVVSTFVLLGVVAVLLIEIIRVSAAEVAIVDRVWTASCAGQTRVTNRVFSISIFIISTVDAAVSGGQTALVKSVLVSKCYITTLARVVFVSADVTT